MKVTELTKCLCCEGELVKVVDFGETPLANNYNVPDKFPLQVNRCVDCYHLQLSHSVDPVVLFGDYPYFSGTSKTFVEFCSLFARSACDITLRYRAPGVQALSVLDIACNDGTQLDAFKKLGFRTYGADPAVGVAQVATSKGHEVFVGRFEDMPGDRMFDIITAQNVLAHTPTPLEFLIRCRSMMRPGSRLFITTSQADLVRNTEFDSVYHEHLSYFNAKSLRVLLARAGLKLITLTTNPIHGTSYVAVVGSALSDQSRVTEREEEEAALGLYTPGTYAGWEKLVRVKARLARETVEQFAADGYTIVGCGAAAKGISFVNISGIELDYLFDTTPAKWEHPAAGTVIRNFEDIAHIRDEKVLFLILAWNFEQEVRQNVLRLRNNPKDCFIVLK